jgi:hypothetical protein
MAGSVQPTLPPQVLGLLDYPEDEGIMVLRNFTKYLPKDTASDDRRSESSSASL